MTTSAPLPPVSAWISATGSASCASITWVAPNWRAHSSFRGSTSTAMIVCAPARCAPSTAASPTPPQPMTATESPRVTAPVLIAAPGHHTAAQQACDLRRDRRVDLGALAGGDEGLLGEGADAQRGRQRRAVVEGHLLLGVVRGEAVPRPAPLARAALAAHRAPVEDDEVAGGDAGHPIADGLDHARRLVPQQVREVLD